MLFRSLAKAPARVVFEHKVVRIAGVRVRRAPPIADVANHGAVNLACRRLDRIMQFDRESGGRWVNHFSVRRGNGQAKNAEEDDRKARILHLLRITPRSTGTARIPAGSRLGAVTAGIGMSPLHLMDDLAECPSLVSS